MRIVPTLLALHALAARRQGPPRPLCQRDRRQADPRRRQGRARDQRRRLLRDHRLHAGRGRARVHGRDRITGSRVRLHAEQLSNQKRRRARRPVSRAVGRPSRASRRGRRQGDGRGRHRRRAAARRLLCAAGKEEAAGRPAAQAQGADRRRDRLQPRHLADAVADAGDEHGVHPVRPDAGGSAGRHDHQRRPRARAGARASAASPRARPPTSPCGGSKAWPSSAIGSACRGRNGGFLRDWMPRSRSRRRCAHLPGPGSRSSSPRLTAHSG